MKISRIASYACDGKSRVTIARRLSARKYTPTDVSTGPILTTSVQKLDSGRRQQQRHHHGDRAPHFRLLSTLSSLWQGNTSHRGGQLDRLICGLGGADRLDCCCDTGQHRSEPQPIRPVLRDFLTRLLDKLDHLGLLRQRAGLERLDTGTEFVEGTRQRLALLNAELLNHASRGIWARLDGADRPVEVEDRLSGASLLFSDPLQVRAVEVNVRAEHPKLTLDRAMETVVVSSGAVHDLHQVGDSDMLRNLTLEISGEPSVKLTPTAANMFFSSVHETAIRAATSCSHAS